MRDNRLTENFTLSEFTRSETARAKGIANEPTDAAYDNIRRLANYLQRVRNCYAKTINITSGYRCRSLNEAVGGAKNSQHVSGEAADLSVGSRTENKKLFEMIRKIGGFDQLIDEADGKWIHVSYRAGRLRGEALRMLNGKYYKA